MLNLNFSFSFADLYQQPGLERIDAEFLRFLANEDEELWNKIKTARDVAPSNKEESELITTLAPYLENFIADLFNIKDEVAKKSELQKKLEIIFKCKRLFVQRLAVKAYKPEEAQKVAKAKTFMQESLLDRDEYSFAVNAMQWLEEKKEPELEYAKIYAGWALLSDEGQEKHKKGVLFKKPKRLMPENLVETHYEKGVHTAKHYVNRQGFALTDQGPDLHEVLDNAHYCIHCHKQEKDSCSKGLKDSDGFKSNSNNIKLAGCPLEEKISEMHLLKTQGSVIGAFATAVIDNPMIAGTGHRICNDCMKSCIYQKQEPVNIPAAETGILHDVLQLPWGFEIYGLLTRWNPLNFKQPLPLSQNGKKVLIAGLGPAGYTLAHYLLNQGCTVVGIDGLKIEPLPSEISGIDISGKRMPFKPIKDIKEIEENLDERIAYGFGGVAEYGITVRWDKNNLTILRLLLERREHFRMYGGVRFGGTIGYQDSFDLGFDHIALALGAGKPNLLDIPNVMAKGVRTASDFLMTLQLSGAARKESLANLTVRLPIVVIGGGLTAVDTATESLAYYPVQVEKFLQRYERVGEEFFKTLNDEEKSIANEFIKHARQLRENPERKMELLKKWGGATVAYRKKMIDSPAYRLNHEEIEKALAEGIEFKENITPEAIDVDGFGYAENLRHSDGNIRAKTIFMAIGTNPNTILNLEDAEHFPKDGKFFRTHDGSVPERVSKPKDPQVLMSVDEKLRGVSFFGDLHPSYAGNVVKAMGSAKQGYRKIVNLLQGKKAENNLAAADFFEFLDGKLLAKIHKIERLTPNIIEIVVEAPLAAMKFEPGQFYRLQNFEATAANIDGLKYATEGLALTGAWVDKEKGLLATIVLEMGASSNICKTLEVGKPVVLMGPTGTPTEIPRNEVVMLVGGGLGNAVLFSIGKALRANGCKVVYFAGYKKKQDRYKIEEIEKAADIIIWACDQGMLEISRQGDYSVHGNIIQAIASYASGELGDVPVDLRDVDRIITIGSDKMMAAIAYERHHSLKSYFKHDHVAIGSINSPMQCMMKEICGQCIQKHFDPHTGQEHYVYSCFNQDQNLDVVDFANLNDRLCQNSLQEKLANQLVRC